jgi:hypothetical protein
MEGGDGGSGPGGVGPTQPNQGQGEIGLPDTSHAFEVHFCAEGYGPLGGREQVVYPGDFSQELATGARW